MPEIEHLKGKIGERDFKKIAGRLKIGNADVFFKNIRRISVAVTSSNTKLNWKKAPFRTEKAGDEWTPHKSEACRAEIQMLLEYDMIEPLEHDRNMIEPTWACGVVMAKKKGGQLRFLLRLFAI